MAGADRQLQQADVHKEVEAFRQSFHRRKVEVRTIQWFFGKALKPGAPKTRKLAFVQGEVFGPVQKIVIHGLPVCLDFTPPGSVQSGIQLFLVQATTLKIGTATKGGQTNEAGLRAFRHAENQ